MSKSWHFILKVMGWHLKGFSSGVAWLDLCFKWNMLAVVWMLVKTRMGKGKKVKKLVLQFRPEIMVIRNRVEIVDLVKSIWMQHRFQRDNRLHLIVDYILNMRKRSQGCCQGCCREQLGEWWSYVVRWEPLQYLQILEAGINSSVLYVLYFKFILDIQVQIQGKWLDMRI